MDRVRLIYTEPHIVSNVENTIRQFWAPLGGVQETKDSGPLCYELKLKGYPWWCSGNIILINIIGEEIFAEFNIAVLGVNSVNSNSLNDLLQYVNESY